MKLILGGDQLLDAGAKGRAIDKGGSRDKEEEGRIAVEKKKP